MAQAQLTPEQKQMFERRLKEFGMSPSQVIPLIRTGDRKGPTIMTADPAVSTYPPHMFTITTLEELKRLTGIPDEDFQNGVIPEHNEIPPAWDEGLNDRMIDDLTAEHNNNVVKALKAYLWGDSSKVASYRQIIEKQHFPMEIAAFAADKVIVSPGSPFQVGPANSGQVYGQVIVEPGGQIQVVGDAHITICELETQ